MIKIILLFFTVFFLPDNLRALKITPAKYEIMCSTGEAVTVNFNILNDSDRTKKILVSSKYWYLNKENKNIPLENWLSYEPPEFVVEPGKEKQISCKITVPENAVGFLNAMLSFTEADKYGGVVSLIFSVPIYVIVKEKTEIDLEISSVTFRTNPVSQKKEFLIGIKNRGNLYFRPKGELKIYRGKKNIFQKDFEVFSPFFPDEEKWLFIEANEVDLTDGKYLLNLVLNIWSRDIEKSVNFKVKKGCLILE